ncbi:MAG: hypothetical protein F6K26_53110 [Moorea sp. SIO2I5]|nr:hypothetical protein [Moorena sp. SIO2I5]
MTKQQFSRAREKKGDSQGDGVMGDGVMEQNLKICSISVLVHFSITLAMVTDQVTSYKSSTIAYLA